MMKRIGIFDTETTDLVKNRITALTRQPEIVAFYCGVYSPKGKLVDELDFKVKPKRPMTPENIAIHGITNEELAERPSFSKYAKTVIAFMQGCDRVVAHNLSFDRDMVEIELDRLALPMRWPPGICTVEQSQSITGQRINLSDLHGYLFGKRFDEAHTAHADGAALARCYFELVKRGYIIQ